MRSLLIALLPLCLATPAMANTRVDSTLFTTYTLGRSSQQINYLVCGSTQESSGCFTSGEIGPFGRVGAIIEGKVRESGDVVTREIYVIDTASGVRANGVTLSVYRKTDTVTATDDTVEVSLVRSVPLPLKGGAHANCYVAGSTSYLYVATDKGPTAVQVAKGSLELTEISSATIPAATRVLSISATTAEAVTIAFGGETPSAANYVSYNAAGEQFEQGGGYNAYLNREIGLSTFELPAPTALAGVAPNATTRYPAVSPPPTTIPLTVVSNYQFETASETTPAFNDLVFSDCGSTPMSSGCFGSQTLGPFGNIGALLGGAITWHNDTLSQHIYVLDAAAGPHHAWVVLYDYLKTDVYDPASGNVVASAKLVNSAKLQLTGGPKTRSWLAGSGNFLYAGTSASTVAAVIETGTLTSSSYGGFSPPVAVGSITVNDYGYVSLVFAHPANWVSGFYLLNKDGQGEEDGGGVEYVVNSLVGLNAEALPP
jgi:hypothetical protein